MHQCYHSLEFRKVAFGILQSTQCAKVASNVCTLSVKSKYSFVSRSICLKDDLILLSMYHESREWVHGHCKAVI